MKPAPIYGLFLTLLTSCGNRSAASPTAHYPWKHRLHSIRSCDLSFFHVLQTRKEKDPEISKLRRRILPFPSPLGVWSCSGRLPGQRKKRFPSCVGSSGHEIPAQRRVCEERRRINKKHSEPETLAQSCWDRTDGRKMRESGVSAADWQLIEYVLCEGTPNTTGPAVAARQDQTRPKFGSDRFSSSPTRSIGK